MLGEHEDNTCPLRRTPCEACGVRISLEDIPHHLSELCARVPRRCTNGTEIFLSVLGVGYSFVQFYRACHGKREMMIIRVILAGLKSGLSLASCFVHVGRSRLGSARGQVS